MFIRAQKSGKRTYLLIVENEWAEGKVRQKVLHRLGRLDILQETGKLDALMLSMQRFSEKFAVLGASQSTDAATGQRPKTGRLESDYRISACGVALPPMLSQC